MTSGIKLSFSTRLPQCQVLTFSSFLCMLSHVSPVPRLLNSTEPEHIYWKNFVLMNHAGLKFRALVSCLYILGVEWYNQCCGSGSGIRCLVDRWTRIRDPEEVYSGSRISDPGSRIPNPYFLQLGDKFFGKKFYNSLKTGPNFFLQHFKNKLIFSLGNL